MYIYIYVYIYIHMYIYIYMYSHPRVHNKWGFGLYCHFSVEFWHVHFLLQDEYDQMQLLTPGTPLLARWIWNLKNQSPQSRPFDNINRESLQSRCWGTYFNRTLSLCMLVQVYICIKYTSFFCIHHMCHTIKLDMDPWLWSNPHGYIWSIAVIIFPEG